MICTGMPRLKARMKMKGGYFVGNFNRFSERFIA